MSDASIQHLAQQLDEDIARGSSNNSAITKQPKRAPSPGPRSQAEVTAREETTRALLRKNFRMSFLDARSAVAKKHGGVGISTNTFWALKKELKHKSKNALNGVQLVSTGRHKGKPYSMKPDAIRKRAQAAKEREAKAAKKQPETKQATTVEASVERMTEHLKNAAAHAQRLGFTSLHWEMVTAEGFFPQLLGGNPAGWTYSRTTKGQLE